MQFKIDSCAVCGKPDTERCEHLFPIIPVERAIDYMKPLVVEKPADRIGCEACRILGEPVKKVPVKLEDGRTLLLSESSAAKLKSILCRPN